MKHRLIYIVLLVLFSAQQAVSEIVVEKSLNGLWMDYNQELKTFLPLEKQIFRKKKVAHLTVSCSDTSNFLGFYSKSAVNLFVNSKLFKSCKEGGYYIISLKDLREFSKLESVYVTFFSSTGDLPLEDIFIGFDPKSELSDEVVYSIKDRSFSNKSSMILLLLFTGLILAIIKISKPTIYKSYFDFSMHFKNIEEHVIFNSFSKTSMLLPVISSILISISVSFLVSILVSILVSFVVSVVVSMLVPILVPILVRFWFRFWDQM